MHYFYLNRDEVGLCDDMVIYMAKWREFGFPPTDMPFRAWQANQDIEQWCRDVNLPYVWKERCESWVLRENPQFHNAHLDFAYHGWPCLLFEQANHLMMFKLAWKGMI